MKIIFLDIDGCLNSEKTFERMPGNIYGLDAELLKIFKDILEKTGAEIVLSSTWRLHKDTRKALTDHGLSWIGCTPDLPRSGGVEKMERGHEIKAWLENEGKKFEIEKFCVLDDDSDILPEQKHFKTSWQEGLTEEVADKIIKFLNS